MRGANAAPGYFRRHLYPGFTSVFKKNKFLILKIKNEFIALIPYYNFGKLS